MIYFAVISTIERFVRRAANICADLHLTMVPYDKNVFDFNPARHFFFFQNISAM